MNEVGLLHLKYDAVPRLDEKESDQMVLEKCVRILGTYFVENCEIGSNSQLQ